MRERALSLQVGEPTSREKEKFGWKWTFLKGVKCGHVHQNLQNSFLEIAKYSSLCKYLIESVFFVLSSLRRKVVYRRSKKCVSLLMEIVLDFDAAQILSHLFCVCYFLIGWCCSLRAAVIIIITACRRINSVVGDHCLENDVIRGGKKLFWKLGTIVLQDNWLPESSRFCKWHQEQTYF